MKKIFDRSSLFVVFFSRSRIALEEIKGIWLGIVNLEYAVSFFQLND